MRPDVAATDHSLIDASGPRGPAARQTCPPCALSVVIATRSRPDALLNAIASLLACEPRPSEILVVDQSPDTGSRDALVPYLDSIRYVPTTTVGVSVARNIGIREATCECIALTDDDCCVARDWPARIEAAMHEHPDVGIVFGNVVACAHDSREGFVPAYTIGRPHIARHIGHKPSVEGISANMALRRDVWRRLHGFDELLGVGGLLRSAAETDLTVRALQLGIPVMDDPSITVTHYGYRAWDGGVVLIEQYLFGIGAMMAKHARCRPATAVYLSGRLLLRWMFGRPVVTLGTSLRRWIRMRAFLRGFLAGWRTPLDRATCRYKGPVTSVGR